MTGGELTKKRDANFELLRIVAMLMIIVLHYNLHSMSLLELGVPASRVNIFATFLEGFCLTGMNAYVFLSGYFLSQSSVKPSRILKLIAQVYFYTILVSVAMIAVGTYVVHADNSVFKTVQYLFPISSEHYWFVTAYVIMYVFAPVMNAAVKTFSRKQLKFTIMGLLLWFCVIKSIVPVMFPTDHYGYDFGWFLCLYLIAAYVRKYDVVLFYNAKRSAIVFVVSCLISSIMSILLYMYNYRFGGLNYYSSVPFHMNYFFILTGSLGLFSLFRFMSLRESSFTRVVRFVAPFTFGVYLLHMHLEIQDRWVEWMEHLFGPVPTESILLFCWHLVRSVLLVFLAGIFVDWIRQTVFEFIGRVLHDSWLFKKIRQWDDNIC